MRRRAPSFAEPVVRRAACRLLVLATALLAAGCENDDSALVIDRAKLMTDEQRRFVETYHEYLGVDHDIDYRVITAGETGDINRFSAAEFTRLGLGSESSSGRGLLLVIDPAQDRVRLEVGYALEGVFPDAFVAYVEHRQMVPFFARRRVADGILAATELIVTRAQRAAANAAFESEVWMAGSGGAGATASARLGQGDVPVRPLGQGRFDAGETPQATLRGYIEAMAARVADPTLALYTPETRLMLAGRVVTAAQMDNVARTYRRCGAQAVKLGPDGLRAVIHYRVDERQCAPWFFRRISGRWHLDLATMHDVIRFGRSNAWHLHRGTPHDYAFAFNDWTFDKHGFPHRQ